MLYLKEGKLPEDKKHAHKVRVKSARFWVSSEGLLYKKSFIGPYLLCIHPNVVQNFLYKLHEGICGSHIGGAIFGAQGNVTGILVARHAERCKDIR